MKYSSQWQSIHRRIKMNEISDRPQKNGFVFFHVAFVVWFGSKFSWARMVFSLNYWARRYLLFKSWRERKKNDAEKTLTLTKIRKMKTKITQKIQLYHNRTEAQPRFPSRELAPKKTEALSQQYNWRILLFIMTWPTFREKNEGISTPLVIIDHIILKLA